MSQYVNADHTAIRTDTDEIKSLIITEDSHPELWAEVVAAGVDPYVAPGATISQPYLNGGGLIRFATFPVAVAEAIKMIGAQRVAKGRYRALHETPMPNDQYAVTPSVFDPTRPLYARITARTETYVEVRVTDLTGAAQDPTELTIETKRVIY